MYPIKREHTAGLQGSDRLTEKVNVSQSGEDADVAAAFFDNVARCCGRQLISVQTINGFNDALSGPESSLNSGVM